MVYALRSKKKAAALLALMKRTGGRPPKSPAAAAAEQGGGEERRAQADPDCYPSPAARAAANKAAAARAAPAAARGHHKCTAHIEPPPGSGFRDELWGQGGLHRVVLAKQPKLLSPSAQAAWAACVKEEARKAAAARAAGGAVPRKPSSVWLGYHYWLEVKSHKGRMVAEFRDGDWQVSTLFFYYGPGRR